MNQFFWNAYKRLEKEVLQLSENIHFSDDQLNVYSSRIGDLLVRTVIEVESLAKVLYFANGGAQPADRDLFFDTDCLRLLENKWLLSKKTIFVSSPYLYFTEQANIALKPLHKACKRGSSASKWQQAYQAVKHDRINNLKKGNVGNLIQALGALYILNIYYRDAKFDTVADKDASDIDWGLGSDLFSVKVSHEVSGASNDKIYVKKADYDECIYLVKRTDETGRVIMKLLQNVNKQIEEQLVKEVMQSMDAKHEAGELPNDIESQKAIALALGDEKRGDIMGRVLKKEGPAIYNAMQRLQFEAVLNKQQF